MGHTWIFGQIRVGFLDKVRFQQGLIIMYAVSIFENLPTVHFGAIKIAL